MKDEIIKLKDVTKIYKNGESEQTVLHNVTFTVNKGEFLGITGDSGSGKTTLLHLMGGLDNVTQGMIEACGKNISKLHNKELEEFRRNHISFIFQNYNLMEELTVWENIIFSARLQGKHIEEEKVMSLINNLGLGEKTKKFPSQLSGGEQQRVAVLRSLISDSEIILADEPTGNLDSRNTKAVAKLLQYINIQYKTTIIMVTHNMELLDYCTKRIKVEDGRIENMK